MASRSAMSTSDVLQAARDKCTERRSRHALPQVWETAGAMIQERLAAGKVRSVIPALCA